MVRIRPIRERRKSHPPEAFTRPPGNQGAQNEDRRAAQRKTPRYQSSSCRATFVDIWFLHHRLQKSMQRLAGVSRIWKDVILKTSRFWTSVKVVPSASLSFLRTHLKRTSQAPLHIYIEEWSVGIDHEISKILEAVLPTTKRWSTLCIDNNSVNFGRIVIHSLEHREFPALTKALLSLSLASSDFLAPAYAPALEDLSVRDISLPFIDDLVSP